MYEYINTGIKINTIDCSNYTLKDLSDCLHKIGSKTAVIIKRVSKINNGLKLLFNTQKIYKKYFFRTYLINTAYNLCQKINACSRTY